MSKLNIANVYYVKAVNLTKLKIIHMENPRYTASK
jgi:hypothetical protein